MKTYRFENWDLCGCPDGGGHSHIGGQIYGHAKYPDGSWVMSDKVVYFDHEKLTAQTLSTGLIQLGEMSDKMKQKCREAAASAKEDNILDAMGDPVSALLEDNFAKYNPEEWGISGKHKGQEAGDALAKLLNDVFGRPGGPDKKRQH